MLTYRIYQCDFAHHWEVRRPEGEPEAPEDAFCPEGHEAVTYWIEEPGDEVQIVIRPASRVSSTGQKSLQDRYLLALLDRRDRELCLSEQHYTWDEVLKLTALFRGKSEARALEWWGRRKP